MVLTTHGVIGLATARLVGATSPAGALAAGFISHFLSDAIPHWHYPTHIFKQFKKRESRPAGTALFVLNREFFLDAASIGMDSFLGIFLPLAISYFFFPDFLVAALCAAVGGVLPDFLQIVYYAFPESPLRYLQRFHMQIHARARLDDVPVYGIAVQAVVGIILLLAALTLVTGYY